MSLQSQYESLEDRHVGLLSKTGTDEKDGQNVNVETISNLTGIIQEKEQLINKYEEELRQLVEDQKKTQAHLLHFKNATI